MSEIYTLEQIMNALDDQIDVTSLIEEGFVAFSRGEVVVPPIAEMLFDSPPGECHMKYGYIKNDDYYVIKVTSGFYENHKVGLPTNGGLVLLFDQKTGALVASLLDDGHLTNIRTAAAGAVVGKYLAPQKVTRVGVCGAGIQGRLQVEYLRKVREFTDVTVWGLNDSELQVYKADVEAMGFNVHTTLDRSEIADTCNVIITATPSKTPLFEVGQIKPGTHFTAMGADTEDKQELDEKILAKADIVCVDSLDQSCSRGETFRAKQAGAIKHEDIIELGQLIENPAKQRQSDDQITVTDLSGVAVQDIQIAKAVYFALQKNKQ